MSRSRDRRNTGGVLAIERSGDLLWVTLDEPDRANALGRAMLSELTELYERDLLDEGVRAVLLGARGRHFSAGADLEHLQLLQSASEEENRQDSERLKALFAAVLEQPALTIALVQGACVAGGCGLATAHDFVVAADDARFMYSEVRIGFVAALVATFLPLRVRGRDIRELLLNPEFLDATRAREIGLVDRVVERDRLATAAHELADEILSRASSASIALTKKVLRETLGKPLDDALALATKINAEARLSADCRLGIATFLKTKKPPVWR